VMSVFSQHEKPLITVLDFTVSEVSQAEMKSVIGLLSSALFKTNCFTVIDVSQRETVLKELEFSLSGCTDESCMLEVGKMLAAEAIVLGNISRVGSKYVFSAKMLETETARTLSTADGIFDNLDALLAGIAGVAGELSAPYGGTTPAAGGATAVGEEPAEAPKAERKPANIPAISTLAGGLACVGAGSYFLAVSLPLLITFTEAQNAYEGGSAAAGDDFTSLYNAYEAARSAAVTGNANTNFIIGASAAGVGVGLGVLSAILFAKAPAGGTASGASAVSLGPADAVPVVTGMIIPLPGATTLSFRVRM
ncbi:MAG: hypothetical protein JW760_12545, partial [Spirochaetales bacterium]|nr:hypothetical protein [Spirochaetales bacterium]